MGRSNSPNIEETARNLGISPGALHRWIRQQKQHEAEGRPAFIGKGKPALTEQEARIKQLERDLDIARQERDILKKAVVCLDPKMHLLAATAAPHGLAALTGGTASLPRNPNEIPIHPKASK